MRIFRNLHFRGSACAAALTLAFLAVHAALAQTRVLDASTLVPPPGARVAIVEFADMQCPACAHAFPILRSAAAKYKIPWVKRDFVITGHPWSRNAAIYARWFDGKGNGLGDDYRGQVFANQNTIYNPNMLTTFTEKFAQSHGLALPFALDPQGKLAAAVDGDTDLGRRVGIQHTPTIFVVMAGVHGTPYIEVQDVDRDLYQSIDRALAQAGPATPSATKPAAKAASKSHK